MTEIACQEEHLPEHWKHGQSPRAVRIAVFRDGHREALCARHLAEARRTGGAPHDEVERTEPMIDQEWRPTDD